MTQSFWLNQSPYHTYRTTAALPRHTSVAIIGGGMTGVSTAYWLQKQGIEVVLLEQRGLSGGATGRNGGHIGPCPLNKFLKAKEKYGSEVAYALWDYPQRTAEAVKTFVADHHIDCELRFTGGAELALSEKEGEDIRRSADLLAHYGLEFHHWDADECAHRTQSSSFLEGLFFPGRGQLWAAKLVFGIAKQAIALGANVQTQTPVHAVEKTASTFTLTTDRGCLQADQVVYATNGWTRHLLPFLKDLIRPVRGQVIITEPVAPLFNFGFSTNFDYEYCMQRPDGRIVLGGMRWQSPTLEENTDDDSQLQPQVSAALRSFLPQHFPALQSVAVEQEWTGIMAFTPDGHPLVGALPHRPGEWIAAGFTGHGMSRTFYAGRMIADEMLGQPSEAVGVAFSPDRFAS